MSDTQWREYIGRMIGEADAAKAARDLRQYEAILADAEYAMGVWREQAAHARRVAGAAR